MEYRFGHWRHQKADTLNQSAHLTNEDLPQLFRAADQASIVGQRRYMGQTRARLILLLMAAALGIGSLHIGESKVDWAAAGALVAFILALLVDTSLLQSKPDRDWYDGRAIAESAKTLSWKWAVGGNPYPLPEESSDPEQRLVEDLAALRAEARSLNLAPVTGLTITEAMRKLRSAPIEQRREAYLFGRLQAQQEWYASKARSNEAAARRWRWLLIGLELLGALGSLLRALDQFDVPLDGLLATAVGAAGTWLEVRRHEQIARAYSITVSDLADARVRLVKAVDDQAWKQAVNDAEDAISREHTRWRASRSQP